MRIISPFKSTIIDWFFFLVFQYGVKILLILNKQFIANMGFASSSKSGIIFLNRYHLRTVDSLKIALKYVNKIPLFDDGQLF